MDEMSEIIQHDKEHEGCREEYLNLETQNTYLTGEVERLDKQVKELKFELDESGKYNKKSHNHFMDLAKEIRTSKDNHEKQVKDLKDTLEFESEDKKTFIRELNKVRSDKIKQVKELKDRLGDLPRNPDFVRVPKELTAENGAKYLFSGEFYEDNTVSCTECDNGVIDDHETCQTCEGQGEFTYKAFVSWTTIKAIWKMGIKHFTPKEGEQ